MMLRETRRSCHASPTVVLEPVRTARTRSPRMCRRQQNMGASRPQVHHQTTRPTREGTRVRCLHADRAAAHSYHSPPLDRRTPLQRGSTALSPPLLGLPNLARACRPLRGGLLHVPVDAVQRRTRQLHCTSRMHFLLIFRRRLACNRASQS